jgi:hypothetical protein
MALSDKEEKFLRLALDPAVQPGEMVAAAVKLIESWRKRSLKVEDLTARPMVVRPARKFYKPDYGLCLWPWGAKYKGDKFKDIPPSYLKNQLKWIREDEKRSERFAELAVQIESFLAQ